MSQSLKLPLSALKLHVDMADIDISLKSSESASLLIGQARAQSALEFGVAMPRFGYNIFVMGEPGLGRLSLVFEQLKLAAQILSTPASLVYIDHFNFSREPKALLLPAGTGHTFSKDIEKLIDDVLATFPAVFDSPTYQQKKTAIERHFTQAYNTAIGMVDYKAQEMGIALFMENDVMTFAPMGSNKPLTDEEFSLLPQAEKDVFHADVVGLEDYLNEVLLELPQWRREMAERIKQVDSDTVSSAIEPLFAELRDKYQEQADVIMYLAEMKQHLVDVTIADILMPSKTIDADAFRRNKQLLIEQYLPNVLVDHKLDTGAPVIYEPHPTYQNLFGRIEYASEQGALVTSYRKICAGSLHKANGGYLVLDAEKLLNYPYVWDGLKRALQAGCIEIDAPYTEWGINTITLKPEVVTLNLKVVLVGSRDIYYLLEELDSEFNEMFKVLADFDPYIPVTHSNIQQLATRIQSYAQEHTGKQLTSNAVQRLIEHSCRLAESQQQFSAHINDTLEIIGEADLFSQRSHATVIEQTHIEQALQAREYRNGRISQEILKEMLDGTILIDTTGEAVGKINGLTVLEIGGSCYGSPARITTTVSPGSRGIVDIEREAELGQSIHSKGVMILSGYLGHFYAQQFPLAISASIAIEQSYSEIDGDSASLAELCCLISALTRTPIKQSFALTGSINQYGEVQAVGGINEKIEGFFRLCQARGLDGSHAVIIPVANKRNLMLKQEVIDAVKQELFAIYAVSYVNQALELLTGQIAGEVDQEGYYPEDSINFRAISRLKEISEMANEEDKAE
ncbi:AAA family ATPase [Methylocucumis oryzae]|uniref:endopeptidase La n=1 Tax=Methylocucumis oryzae TaxID=1632867 RepID=A0A0F3IGU0_9GAMM|nr:AAA family ATPase [Methylocucumis oryzae]KJV05917.1 ATP-dependent protease [Methylocucumis oryzae]